MINYMPDPALLRLLNEFLVGNSELETLNARLSTFNLFRVLRVEEAEIRHSNVLAWLLDPTETHGLGVVFVRRFLASVLMDADPIPGVTLTPAQVELMPFGEVEVYRERHHIDILVRCVGGRGADGLGWCLLIENKIHSKESAGQLAKYRRAVEDEFGGEIIPILLTLDGDDPSDEGEAAGFIAVSHQKVFEVASAVIEQHRTRIPSDAHVFLTHYLTSLMRLTMPDQEIVDLCKKIYRRHREAVELIWEHGRASEVLDNCAAEIATLVDCSYAPHVARRRVWFVPKELGSVMPTVDMAGWKWLPDPVPPVCFWLRYSRTKLRAGITLEVGPVADKNLRQRILKEAEAHGIPVKEKQFETAKYARLVTESMPLKEDIETGEAEQSEEYLREVCKTLWQKVWPKAKPIVPAIKAALAK